MKVQRYNYANQFGPDIDRLLCDLREMIVNGRYVLGPDVLEFETRFASFLSVGHARCVSSGSDALMIGLMALGVGWGGETKSSRRRIRSTPRLRRSATSGATPVRADDDESSYLIDATAVAEAITSRTRIRLPVHLCGKQTPMKPLLALADKHCVTVVEDAAQAVGARYDGVRAGTSGRIGMLQLSSQQEPCGCGRRRRDRHQRSGGCRRDPASSRAGSGSSERSRRRRHQHELDAIQARILTWKLGDVDRWTTARQAVAHYYRDRLQDLPLRFQSVDPLEEHAYHMFQVRTEERDALLAHLQSRGIDAVVIYPVPIHLQPAFADAGWRKGQFPVSERLARELLCLPIRPDMTEGETEEVVRHVRTFFRA